MNTVVTIIAEDRRGQLALVATCIDAHTAVEFMKPKLKEARAISLYHNVLVLDDRYPHSFLEVELDTSKTANITTIVLDELREYIKDNGWNYTDLPDWDWSMEWG